MQVKTTCVRCGKAIQGTYVYCDRCERIARDGAAGHARSSRTRALIIFILLLAVVGGGFFAWRQGLITMPGEQQFVRATEVIQNTDAPKATITEALVAKKLDQEQTPPPTPLPNQENAPQPPADADLPEPESEISSGLDSTETTPMQDAVASNVDEASVHEQTTQRQDIPANPPPSPTAAANELIWIFHAQETEHGERLASTLRTQGFQHVEFKGHWMTKHKVNYLFFRPEAEEGVDDLKIRAGLHDIKSIPYSVVQTSANLQRAFEENSKLAYLFIVQ